MSRRMISLFLAACLLLGLAACGDPEPTVPSTDPITEPTTDPTTEPTSEPTAEPTNPPTGPSDGVTYENVSETVYANTTVNVRSGPGTEYDIVGMLYEGSAVVRTGLGSNGWSRVLYNGETAYIRSDFLQSGSSTESGVTFSDVEETVYAVTDVNIRSGPGTEYTRIALLTLGSSVTRTGVGSNGWSRILYEGQIAYIHSDFLSLDKPGTGNSGGVMDPPDTFDGPSSYYSDAVFIGDSISMMLRNRCTATGDLPGATFLVRGSYGVGNAVYDNMLLTYQGQSLNIEDAIAATGATKVFLMMGMNDLNIYGVDGTIELWETMISRIREKNPNVTIVIQSMTPVLTGSESGLINNTSIDSYNDQLRAFAASSGCHYLDVASYLKDGTNGLAPAYCSDDFVHVTPEGADVWIKVLKAFAGY